VEKFGTLFRKVFGKSLKNKEKLAPKAPEKKFFDYVWHKILKKVVEIFGTISEYQICLHHFWTLPIPPPRYVIHEHALAVLSYATHKRS